MSLFDVEDTDAGSLKVRDMVVAKVSQGDVTEFCRRYHYAITGGNMTWNWGLWHGPILLGVVSYNLPSRTACEAVFGQEHFDKVWHMGRLAMADDAPRNSESRLIGGSLREIGSNHDTWGILTFADTTHGHLGYVYQATNALYCGRSEEVRYWLDPQGARRSRKGLFDAGLQAGDAIALGWTFHRGTGKHRYLYILGSKTQRKQRRRLLKLPVLPYPKAEQVSA